MDNKYYLSEERLNQIKKEYQQLITEERMAVAEKLKKAKEFGDLSENAEYNEAKDEQAQLERRVGELEDIIKNAELVKKTSGRKEVGIGSTVIVKKEDGKEIKYTIVGSQEINPEEGKISNESPVGSALLGKRAGDKVEVKTIKGKSVYEVKAVK